MSTAATLSATQPIVLAIQFHCLGAKNSGAYAAATDRVFRASGAIFKKHEIFRKARIAAKPRLRGRDYQASRRLGCRQPELTDLVWSDTTVNDRTTSHLCAKLSREGPGVKVTTGH
jgi:hypothetical protein